MATVCAAFGLSHAALISDRRHKTVAWPRHMAMFLIYELTGLTTPQIARQFGDRDHSSVGHALRRVSDRIDRDPEVRETIKNLRAKAEHDLAYGGAQMADLQGSLQSVVDSDQQELWDLVPTLKARMAALMAEDPRGLLRKLATLTLAAALWIGATGPAPAETVCGDRDAVLRAHEAEYGERPAAMGLAQRGAVLEVLTSPKGSWTVILTLSNGLSCLIATGDAWETLPTPVAGERS